jgi:NAD(P)-dependent dehydrogenase (short-subunit alcohol dehydrogenase family)
LNREKFRTLFDMTDRVVIVTGGTRGLGLALAEGYIAAGAKVVVASRKSEACNAAQQHLQDMGGQALGIPTHQGELDDLKRLVQRTVDAFGGIDVVVNNAANALGARHGAHTPEVWGKSLDINLRGPVFLVQEALPHLKQSKYAAVLNIVSPAAYLYSQMSPLYAIAKAGLVSATRSMAAEFANAGIRVNALCPGTMDTDMVRKSPKEIQERLPKMQLLQRIASPDELVGPALLLTSDAGSFITGSVLFADGGLVPR